MLHEAEQSSAPQLEEIATFLRVAECGSLTEAARRLALPKSTVSRRLSRLEEKLGVQLLHRTTRRVSLTDAGAAYRERAASALAGLDEAAEAVREQRGTPRGHLRITAPPDLGSTYFADLVAEFVGRYRESTVEVVLADRALDLVAEGIDLAVRATSAMADSSLVARRIASVDLYLVASPTYLRRRGVPRGAADLAEHDFVLLRAAHGRGTLRLRGPAGEDETVEVRAAISANDFGLVHRATMAHAGIAALPNIRADPEIRGGRLRRVLPDRIAGTAGLFVVHPGARLLSANVRAFRDLLIERLDAAGLESPPLGAPARRGNRKRSTP